MTPDRYDTTLESITDVVRALRQLQIPPERVHSISVEHWTDRPAVVIHINGETSEHVEMVDRIADHYGLSPDDGKSGNYDRGDYLGQSPVRAYCGRPDDNPS